MAAKLTPHVAVDLQSRHMHADNRLAFGVFVGDDEDSARLHSEYFLSDIINLSLTFQFVDDPQVGYGTIDYTEGLHLASLLEAEANRIRHWVANAKLTEEANKSAD